MSNRSSKLITMCLFWVFSVILAGCSGSANQIQGQLLEIGGTGYVTSSDGFVFSTIIDH